jgi:hypothetical protein
MRQLTEMGIIPAGLVACGGVVLLVGIRRHRRAQRPVLVVNAGVVALCGGTVTVVGEASGRRGSGP